MGINKGNFVEMVAKKYSEEQGYKVECYYYLVRNKNKRERMPGFKKICHIFSEAQVRLLIAEADKAFRSIGKKIASGDPDLFAYNENSKMNQRSCGRGGTALSPDVSRRKEM